MAKIWGQWRDSTYCGCIAAAEALGAPVRYETLMGVSGLCYRICMKTNWCPSAGVRDILAHWGGA